MQLRAHILVRKDVLDRALSVVEVALDCAHADVFALLGHHLPLLHVGDAARRIEDDDVRPLDVAEALERRLAGVARRRDHDQRLVLFAHLAARGGQKMRQHCQRHILERACRTVPKFEHIQPLVHTHERTGIAVKTRVCLSRIAQQFFIGEVGEIERHDLCRPLGVVHAAQFVEVGAAEPGKRLGDIESPVGRQPVDDRLRAVYRDGSVASAGIFHKISFRIR